MQSVTKLEALVAKLNTELAATAAQQWPDLSTKIEGPALVYANGRLVLTETQTPTAPNDAVGLHAFHVLLSVSYGQPETARGGREKQQRQSTRLALVIYSTERDAYDVLVDAAVRQSHFKLQRAELHPQAVRKLLGLDKDVNATNAGEGRYLFAVVYEVDFLVGGLLC